MKKKILFPLFLCCLFVFAMYQCLAPQSSSNKKPSFSEYNYPFSFMIDNKNNFFDYQPGYECSAFSSSYVLRHYGSTDTGLKLFENFPDKLSNGGGVYPTGIVSMFESRGFNAELITHATIDDLKQELSKGAPVIVYIHVDPVTESPHYTHYVPIVGYDEENFYFAESLPYKSNYKDQKDLSYNRKTDIETFKKLWVDVDIQYQNPFFQISQKN